MDIEFKPKFIERYSKLTDWEEFKRYSLRYLRRSIRVNTLKISVEELLSKLENRWKVLQIPWCREGFWIESKEGRRDVGNLLLHQMGYFYIQEAASMIPPILLSPAKEDIVLDCCASPGSKAGQIAIMMQNKGVLIANDCKASRMVPLSMNLRRLGIMNTVITMNDASRIKGIEPDKILVDAPCSGTGTIRKSLKTIRIWNPNMVKKIARMQKRILLNSFDILKAGGSLVYSTCSLEPEENEGVIDHLLRSREDASVERVPESALPGLKRGKAAAEFEGESYDRRVSESIRIWPQDNDTEGFYLAKIKKEE